MILFLSDGRLGNQIFQYAFLNTIAKKNEKIITSNMNQFVEMFDIRNKNFFHFKNRKYIRTLIRNVIKPLFFFLAKLRLIGYITQDKNNTSALSTFTTKKGFLSTTLVETDFFQSEKFFNKEKIDFKLKDNFIKEAYSFLNQIQKDKTKIFVHVRRGDYVSETYLNHQGINLPKSYFESAIKEITKDIQNPFFIFVSDDHGYIEDCFENLKNKIISRNNMAIDLAIMSLCEYGIVSNSSFSWWGAYFMKERKEVIFPKYWYGWKCMVDSHIDIQPTWSKVIDLK